jgi:hypothetical protein
MRNQFSTDQIKLIDLIGQAETGKLQLPNFQRGYNWKTNSVLKLLDSIHKGHPAGSLLFLETKEPAIIAYEPIRTVESEVNVLAFPNYLILDGQQRLTSCHAAFHNKGRNSYFIDLWQLYYNYGQDYEEIELIDNKIIIAKKHSSQPEEFLFSSDLLALTFLRNNSRDFRSKLYPYKQNLRNSPDTDPKFLEFIDQELDNFIEPFFEYEFPVVILPHTLTIEGICKVFQSINTTGLRLSAYDICVATFMPYDINLKELLDNALSEHQVLEPLCDVDQTIVLQVIALLSGKSPKKNNLPKSLEPTHIRDEWSNAILGLVSAVDVFDKIGVGLSVSAQLVPYQPMIPVLAATLVKKDYHNQPVHSRGVMIKKISMWFFKSALEMRYTEGTDNKMTADYSMLRDWLSIDTVPKQISNPLFWSQETVANANKNGAFGKAILVALNSGDIEDWYTQDKVGVKAGLSVKSQLHHIFPHGAFLHFGNINSVFNFTFLTGDSNHFIKDDKPSSYIPRIASNLGITEKDLADKLKAHFIDTSTIAELRKDNFEGFVNSRIVNFANFLNNEIGLNIQFTQDDQRMDLGFDNDDNFVQGLDE